MSGSNDDSKVRARLQFLAQREKRIRERCLHGPAYFGGDLAELERFHESVAAEVSEILDRSGWPGISHVGWDAALAGSELVRGCWSCPRFMRACLPLVEQAFRFGDIPGEWFARLYDTIMFLENKPQVYGTYLDWNARGSFSPWRTTARASVDRRRAAITMEKMSVSVNRARAELKARDMLPPRDLKGYRRELHAWAIGRGWVRSHPDSIRPEAES